MPWVVYLLRKVVIKTSINTHIGDNDMKDFIKNKKVWIGVAVVIIVIGWALWSGQPAPEVTH